MSSRNKGAIRERQRKEGRAIAGRTPPGISRHSCSRRERSSRLFVISITATFLIFCFLNFFFSDQFPIHRLKRASCCHIDGLRDVFCYVYLGLSFSLWCSATLGWWSPVCPEVTDLQTSGHLGKPMEGTAFASCPTVANRPFFRPYLIHLDPIDPRLSAHCLDPFFKCN